MADPSTYRPRPGEIPVDPGVYRFRDKEGRVIYVGKAKSLRSRLSSYFQDIAALHPRTRRMVTTGASVEWTVVKTEVEALQLEYSWIKEFDPRFNVKYRDDKSYPYLAVTMGEEFPRAQVMRGAKRKGTRYFGPYGHAWAIRETLDLLLKVFPLRTCSAGVFRRAEQVGRPCLLGYIDKCSAPCVGRVTAEEHREIAEDFCDFMAGSTTRFVRRVEREMQAASQALEFERAAMLRDNLQAMTKALEKSAVVLGDATDADVFAVADDELEAAVQVFHVRGGRIRGQRGWVVERDSEDVASLSGLTERLLQQVYGGESGDGVPREVLVPVLPDDAAAVEEWLSGLRGSRVDVRVPRRGDKRALLETVRRNADQALARHKVSRAGDLTARSQALQELQEALELDDAPLRVECYDVSHVQGTNVVASMVVFEDGLPRKAEYRRFIVRGDGPPGEAPVVDDTAAMREVLTRRFRRHVAQSVAGGEEGQDGPQVTELTRSGEVAADPAPDVPAGIDPETGRARRFAYAPQLVVVDGGLPQVNAAQAVLDELGVDDVALVGLAKRLEEVWVPGQEFPVILPRTSEGLYLLQRVRDEAHRFAITFHRQRRSKAMTTSALDGIPGLGAARQKALLKTFGSVKRLRAASVEELQAVPGIGPALAETVHERLGAGAAEPAINLTTGEVIS
ncbi:excinuclease ABC subunit UvrC [Arsenicicoccus sp. oral taxon 190]|uniref:excinuclease ABC subunit UvrC n=1 Tax=Arsenicicoccus sp. oral taxon 190 TaxID=1658671 RepID=UPI000679F9DB|nr:excinuclease ABC subunit UvrC [Arsenicicoccus sp. oral taxon 190]AKT51770.1 excinuclease ABC subunit C [Arsenicicoccus sp. oral taxon 190]